MLQHLPNTLFVVVMALAVMGWLTLIVFPRRSWANFWFAGLAVPVILCFIYIYFLLTYWFQPPTAQLTQFVSLAGVHAMFGNSGLLLVAWINIVAMDLVVGAWMARKAAQIRMPYVYLLPCLIITFAFAGAGFTLYATIAAMKGSWGEIAKFDGPPGGSGVAFVSGSKTTSTLPDEGAV